MDNQSIITYKSAFDAIMHEITADDGSQLEVWYARELQKVCGYARWENFQVAINRAIDACKSQNINIDDHFRDVTKMVSLGSGSERDIKDILLTRYACRTTSGKRGKTTWCRTNTAKEIINITSKSETGCFCFRRVRF